MGLIFYLFLELTLGLYGVRTIKHMARQDLCSPNVFECVSNQACRNTGKRNVYVYFKEQTTDKFTEGCVYSVFRSVDSVYL